MSHGSRFTAALAAGLVAAAVFTAPAAAQSSAFASIAATATVSGIVPLTASGPGDLAFGTVTAGTPKSVTGTSAGRFTISGQPSRAVSITFTLPTVLAGSGSATIPITFSSTDGLLWSPYPTASSGFNPNAPFSTPLDATGNLTIGIGGTVSPPALATSGLYSGTITLTVAY